MMKPCRFTFDDSPEFDGYAHGSTWNGFDNVAVTRDVLDRIVAWLKDDGAPQDDIDAMLAIEPLPSGLISLGWGYATQITSEVAP